MVAEWNGIRAEAKREYWRRGAERNESQAEAEYKYGNQQRMESEFDGRRDITIKNDEDGGMTINHESRNTNRNRYLPSGQFMMKDRKTNTGSYKPMV